MNNDEYRMTNTISVPRELLERIVGKCKLSVLGDDHAKVWELLAAAPKAEQPPVQEPARNPDVLALNAAREIVGLVYGPTLLGRSTQLLAQIQCVVSEAIVYAAPQPVSDDARDALVEALEDAIDYLNEPLNSIQHGSILYSQMCEALAAYRAAQEKK